MLGLCSVDRLFCAVDTADLDEALLLAELLSGEVGAIKLGKEFFTAHGPKGVAKVAEFGHKIFLDLKYHDIPNTVAGAVRAAAKMKCAVLTVHASGGFSMLQAATQAAVEEARIGLKVLAVTVLTSLDETDLKAVGQGVPISDQVQRLARLAKSAGVQGLVCSPLELKVLKEEFDDSLILVVPGVRITKTSVHDQKRVMTPGEAVRAGADHVVIGRPITLSDDPVGAVRRIIDEIEKNL